MVAAKKRRRGEVEKLPVARLEMALDEAIDSQASRLCRTRNHISHEPLRV